MNVLLNNEPIEITLQDEKTIGDLLIGLTHWLDENGLFLLGFSIDGSEQDLDKSEKWKDVNITDISEINIWANHPVLMQKNQLELLTEYFTLLETTIFKHNHSKDDLIQGTKEVLDQIPLVLTSLEPIFPEEQAIPRAFLKELSQSLKIGVIKNDWTRQFNTVKLLLQERIREYTSPRTELLTTMEILQRMQEPLSMVSTQLQHGETDLALHAIQTLVEIIHKLARCMDIFTRHPEYTQDLGNALQEKGNKLNQLLEELVTGMEQQDIVLMGDILEYELSDIFKEIEDLLSEQPT
jgi:hypothetical protein